MAKETNRKQEKQEKASSFTEEDSSDTLLEKYQASTVLTLLQEIANHIHQQSQRKIEWNDLVEKTSTGISNAREYQMLWRHLAYGHALVEDLEDGAPPLDDDSDLECEREAFPPVSKETASEAAACVQRHVRNNVSSTRAKKVNGSVSDTTTSIEKKINTLSKKEDIRLREGNCTNMTGKDEKNPSELYKVEHFTKER